MVGTRALADLVSRVHQAGAKIVLIGDACQLPEIEAGGAFAGLARRTNPAVLRTNRRQHERWERQALADLRLGHAPEALAAYQAVDFDDLIRLPLKVLQWLGKEDAPLLFRIRADLRQWLWGLQFLRECTPARTRSSDCRVRGCSACCATARADSLPMIARQVTTVSPRLLNPQRQARRTARVAMPRPRSHGATRKRTVAAPWASGCRCTDPHQRFSVSAMTHVGWSHQWTGLVTLSTQEVASASV